MEKQDFFHEIAKTKHPIDSTDREIQPREIQSHVLPHTGKKFLTPMEAVNYEKQKRQFQEELAKLRVYYKPFMADYAPMVDTKTERMEFQKFQFRYVGKEECFTDRNRPDYQWEEVTIPDYRGPAGEEGRWDGYYKSIFFCPGGWRERCGEKQRMVLTFQCVDYIAEVYVNGNFVGRHEGLFAPFSFDVTKYIREENELIILCRNDVPILGVGEFLDGDKIYAATGPGWDDSKVGWHHCPAGAGVFGKVGLELRPSLFIDDIFVRPDMENQMAELRVGVINYGDEVVRDCTLSLSLNPKNYKGEVIGSGTFSVKAVGPGKNEYRYFIALNEARIWEPDTPWLYSAAAILEKDGQAVSAHRQTFGLKTFVSDENSNPKGKFYFNGKPIVLRGANEMGHLQQCVMQGDFDQLVDDILIAKLCNMNYYRVTQRPVQEEIYDYFDMLGMMHQCDFPLFGFLRRPQFSEAVRQVTEMEHLVRKHVSTVMVTFINEPMCVRKTEDPTDKFSRRYEAKGHRHLLRDELEAFFVAARKAIYVENPDRVIKNVEGDYDGPTAEGMPDFHTYTMWYTNHGQPIGKLMRGYLPPVKEGWMIGCGEYGAEGLDPASLMKKAYPKEWLETDEEGNWYPDKIVRAQTHSVQGDWYKEQNCMEDWVRESQIHQARATKLMTDAFRRRGDVINHTAVHLLIDAWPSGWMKTLLDCERTPKRAYFAYKEALIPLRVNLYSGRNSGYEGETISVEAWVLNDTSSAESLVLHAEVWEEGEDSPYDAFEEEVSIGAADAACAGILPISIPVKGKDRKVTVQAAILNRAGEVLHREELSIQAYTRSKAEMAVHVLGAEAKELAELYGITEKNEDASVWLMSGQDTSDLEKLEEHMKQGGKALWLLPEEKTAIPFGETEIRTKGCGDLFFAAADGRWERYPVSMLYNEDKGYIDSTSKYTVDTELAGEALFYTYSKQGFLGSKGAKAHLPFVKRCRIGDGTLLLCTLARSGRVGCNGGLDRLLLALLEEGYEGD